MRGARTRPDIRPVQATPGMVRVSLGVYNTEEEIDVLLSTVRDIAEQ